MSDQSAAHLPSQAIHAARGLLITVSLNTFQQQGYALATKLILLHPVLSTAHYKTESGSTCRLAATSIRKVGVTAQLLTH